MVLCPLCPLHPQFAQWMLSAGEARGCADLFHFTLQFIRSVSVSSACKTVTSSGETISHKTSLKLAQTVKLKAFTHLAVHTVDMIISHRVWAQFSIPFSLASQRPLLFQAQTGRQAGRHACLYLYTVQHSSTKQATNLSNGEENTHLQKATIVFFQCSSACVWWWE